LAKTRDSRKLAMARQLDDATITVVKATVPALKAHGEAITRRMYDRLFEDASIKTMFDQSRQGEGGQQPVALATAILAYARNIDRLDALAGPVEHIAKRHVSLGIAPEHYPVVASALLAAIVDVLGEAATPEILAAWEKAYWVLADLLVSRETALYASAD
jgi:nitric oxide dioxygenase